ncbi:MAG: carbohydrate ABC transporter permease, partial [Lacrimispora sphenoides]
MMNSGKKRFTSVLVTAIGMGTVFVMIFPIIWLLMSSFKDSTELFAYPLHFFPKEFTFKSYESVIASGFFTYVKNSLFLAVVGTAITLVISSMCGYALAIYRHDIPYTNKVF